MSPQLTSVKTCYSFEKIRIEVRDIQQNRWKKADRNTERKIEMESQR